MARLTARIGTAAIDVMRPLPFLDREPVRARDLLPELFRRAGGATAPKAAGLIRRRAELGEPASGPDAVCDSFARRSAQSCRMAAVRAAGSRPARGRPASTGSPTWRGRPAGPSASSSGPTGRGPRTTGRHPDEKPGRGFPAEEGDDGAGQHVAPVEVHGVRERERVAIAALRLPAGIAAEEDLQRRTPSASSSGWARAASRTGSR